MARPKVPKSYGDPHLHCRTFGHTWHVGEGFSEGASYWRFVLLCQVCKTRRLDLLNRRTGGLVNRRYEYQPGYQSEPHEGLARTTYRIEFIRRLDRQEGNK
jgi:hypothetical protein